MKARTLFWLGIGLLVAGAAIASPVTAQVAATVVAKPSAIAPQDLAFGRFIALIRAHLLTGQELVGDRAWDAAEPHFRFPTEEIYGVIRDQLRAYRTPPFDGALKTLARTVKAHSARQYPKALQKVEEALAAADAGLKSKVPVWPRFVVAEAVETLKSAPDEYEDAVAKGRIVRPIGYQTTRGFILQADRMLESVAGEFAGENAAAVAEMRAGFAELKQAFATVKAPKQAPIEEKALLAIIAKIEQAAGKLT